MMLAVKLNNIGKKYTISHEKEAIVRHILPRFLKIKSYEEFWALRNINLEVTRGQTISILGRNGAGKSTLLNVVSGITFPTEGRIYVNGKISALLSLGAGFHQELTGEENIYINGSILGLKIKEIKKRFKEIVEFSELGDFINAPIQTYSAGMYMRLGFAIAANVDFDILIIDEILTVGDLSFQNKCLEKLRYFQKIGKTIMMVSQSLDLVNVLCDKVVLLDKGKILLEGRPQEVTSFYQEMMSKKIEPTFIKKETKELSVTPVSGNPVRQTCKEISGDLKLNKDDWGTKTGTKDAEIINVRLLNSRSEEVDLFKTGERMRIEVKYLVHKDIEDPHFGVAVFKEDGTYCYGPNTRFDGLKIERLRKGSGSFSIEYESLNLLPGKYRISIAIWEKNEKFAYDYHNACYEFDVISDKKDHGIVYLRHRWSWKLP